MSRLTKIILLNSIGVFVLVLGMWIGVRAVKTNSTTPTQAAAASGAVSLYVNPSQQLILDAGVLQAGYVKTSILFDITKIKLGSDAVWGTQLKNKLVATAASTANATGVINIVAGINPADKANYPTGKIVVATLNFVPVNNTVSFQTVVSIGTTNQVIDAGQNDLAVNTTATTLSFLVPTSAPTIFSTGVTFEAEAGNIAAPFTISNGTISQIVSTTPTTGGRAAYTISIPASGNYQVTGVVNAPGDPNNSFYINFDSEPTDPTMIWDILPYTTGLANRTVAWRGTGTYSIPQFSPKIWYLTAGSHTLIIRGREPGVLIDKLRVDTAATSTGGNCTSNSNCAAGQICTNGMCVVSAVPTATAVPPTPTPSLISCSTFNTANSKIYPTVVSAGSKMHIWCDYGATNSCSRAYYLDSTATSYAYYCTSEGVSGTLYKYACTAPSTVGSYTNLCGLRSSLSTACRDSMCPLGSFKVWKPGDANGDNAINSSDYYIWYANNGKTTTQGAVAADFNGDGIVDSADYAIWYANRGK